MKTLDFEDLPEEVQDIIIDNRAKKFMGELFDYATNKGLTFGMAATFARFYYYTFGVKHNYDYWDTWIHRFKQGFENIWAHADSLSRFFLCRAMFHTIEQGGK